MFTRLRRPLTYISASALALAGLSMGLLASNAGAAGSAPGVTSNSITIGATVPLSGVAASYAPVSAAANAVFKWIDAHGGVNWRQIKSREIEAFLSRLFLAVEAGNIGHNVDLFLVKTQQLGILYDIIGMGMVIGKRNK